MKMHITKERFRHFMMEEPDGPSEVGSVPGSDVLNLFVARGTSEPSNPAQRGESLAFGTLIQLLRRREGVASDVLAKLVEIDVTELLEIERNVISTVKPRTVRQLAKHFKLPPKQLMYLAGVTISEDRRLYEEAVKFAARSENLSSLNEQELRSLNDFVQFLSRRDED